MKKPLETSTEIQDIADTDLETLISADTEVPSAVLNMIDDIAYEVSENAQLISAIASMALFSEIDSFDRMIDDTVH